MKYKYGDERRKMSCRILCNKKCGYITGATISFLLAITGLFLLYLNRLLPQVPILVGAFMFLVFFVVFGLFVYLLAKYNNSSL